MDAVGMSLATSLRAAHKGIGWNLPAAPLTPVRRGVAMYANDVVSYYGGSADTNLIQEYDIVDNSWKKYDGPYNITYSQAIHANNGYSYFPGNNSGNTTMYRFYRPTNSWSSAATLPTGVIYPAHAYDYDNGKIYIMGGNNAGDRATNQIYNLATNSWSYGASIPYPSSYRKAGYHNGKVYYFYTTAETHVYDIASNSWTIDTTERVGTYPASFNETAGSNYLQYGTQMWWVNNSSDVYRYDFATNTTDSFLHADNNSYQYSQIVIDTDRSRLHIFGGDSSTYYYNHNIYDIAANEWAKYDQNLYSSWIGFQSVSDGNGNIYLFGGASAYTDSFWNSYSYFNANYSKYLRKYNIPTKTWTNLADWTYVSSTYPNMEVFTRLLISVDKNYLFAYPGLYNSNYYRGRTYNSDYFRRYNISNNTWDSTWGSGESYLGTSFAGPQAFDAKNNYWWCMGHGYWNNSTTAYANPEGRNVKLQPGSNSTNRGSTAYPYGIGASSGAHDGYAMICGGIYGTSTTNYIAGQTNNNTSRSCLVYTDSTSSSTYAQDMLLPTAFSAYATTNKGKVYIIGGATTGYNSYTPTDFVQVFDLYTKTWNAGPKLPFPIAFAKAEYYDNKIYVFGGYNKVTGQYNAEILVLNLKENDWVIGQDTMVNYLATT